MKNKLNEFQIATLEIIRDPEPQNPREWDNLGRMACWHRRMTLGDTNPTEGIEEWRKKNALKGSVVLPLYMMDHSGVTLRTEPQSFRAADSHGWDWGLLGIIVATPKAIRDVFAVKKITKKTLERAKKALELEVVTYNDFLNGQCWGFVVTDGDGEEDSCWGFIGSTLEETGLAEAIPEGARHLLKEAWEKRK